LATGIRSLLSCGRYRTVSELEALYCPASAESEHFKNLLSYKSSGELRGGRYGEAKEKKTI
jgi:hypothetical protein